MQATTVREALRASLAGTFGTILSVLPRILVLAIVLAVGWVISSLLARATIALLGALRFNDMARRSGLARFIQNMGVRQDPTGVIASVAKWCVRLMALVLAFDALGLPAVSGVLHQLLLWLPNLAVGLVALVIGGLAATALARLVQGSAAGAGIPNPRALAFATSVAVWAFTVVVGVSQLGVATSLVNTVLIGVVGAVALAAGLAFGLAGRDRAAQLLSVLAERSAASPAASAASESPSATAGSVSPPVPTPPAPPSAPTASASPPAPTDATSPPAPTPSTSPPAPSSSTSPPASDASTSPPVSQPDDEPALVAGPRMVPFEEGWMLRSGLDRRRMARPGPDRRAGVA